MRLPLLIFCASACGIAAAERHNVILIAVDDLKPTLGCYGDSVARTPHIDALARRGMVFARHYVQQAVCAPSRNSLLTGVRPEQLGIYDLATPFRRVAPDIVTWPQALIAAGWRCEPMGKIEHLGHGNAVDRASWSARHVMPAGNHSKYQRPGAEPVAGSSATFASSWAAVPNGAADTLIDAQLSQRASKRIEALAKEKTPFVLAVGFLRPHLPFVAPQRCYDQYDPAALPVPPTDAVLPQGAPDFAGHTFGELRMYADLPAVGRVNATYARQLVHGYYACVSWTDEQVGRILATVDRLGLADSTTIVLWGDHGWHLGDHGLWCKHTNYEQATRSPLIIAGPGVAAGTTSAALVETIDLAPTFLARAGVAAPATMRGVDLSPVLADPTAAVHDAVFHCYPRAVDGVRAARPRRARCPLPPGALAGTADRHRARGRTLRSAAGSGGDGEHRRAASRRRRSRPAWRRCSRRRGGPSRRCRW